ncbi:OmpH family outer membrane protein [Polaribacter sp.]|nr:OmpH family outer membrane protein [Polaribacter sp.]
MRKLVLLIVLSLMTFGGYAQKSQRIAYIDMEYILENLPEYIQAQNTLNDKIAKWKKNLDTEARHIEVLKTDLANEKAILTNDLIEEKEEDIALKQEELRRLESLYFGPNGDMFLVRKQLVKPIQDQVYYEVQKIVKAKKYDFVFDKSSELILLYSNKKYDISEIVLASIDKTRKVTDRKAKQQEKKTVTKEVSDRQKALLAAKKKKRDELLAKKEKKKQLIADRRAELLAKKEAKRKQLKEKQEAAKKKKEEQKNNNN